MILRKRQQTVDENEGKRGESKSVSLARSRASGEILKQRNINCLTDSNSVLKRTECIKHDKEISKRIGGKMRNTVVNECVVAISDAQNVKRQSKKVAENHSIKPKNRSSKLLKDSVLCSTPQKPVNNEDRFHVTQLSPILLSQTVEDERATDDLANSDSEVKKINPRKPKKVCKKLYGSEIDDCNNVSWKLPGAKRWSYSKRENSGLFDNTKLSNVSSENDDPFNLFSEPPDRLPLRKMKKKNVKHNKCSKKPAVTKNDVAKEKEFLEWCDSFNKNLEEIDATELVIE
ncbi:hypothetical protein CHUAL_012304 [Chamberlinius hualienensis]